MHMVFISNIFRSTIVWCEFCVCLCDFGSKNTILVELFLAFWVWFFGLILREKHLY